MCLTTVEKEFNKKGKGKAYKVLVKNHDVLSLPFFYNKDGTRSLKLDQWYKSREQSCQANDDQQYTAGFHLLTSIKDALIYKKFCKEWFINSGKKMQLKIVEVKYAEKMHVGRQNAWDDEWSVKCIVANKIKVVRIISNPKNESKRPAKRRKKVA